MAAARRIEPTGRGYTGDTCLAVWEQRSARCQLGFGFCSSLATQAGSVLRRPGVRSQVQLLHSLQINALCRIDAYAIAFLHEWRHLNSHARLEFGRLRAVG